MFNDCNFFLSSRYVLRKSMTIFTKDMELKFDILPNHNIEIIIPLVEKLNDYRVSRDTLRLRFQEMITQNYECVGVFDGSNLIGCCGLWFCTRHYSGKSVEMDHVFIDEDYRNRGIGKKMCDWIYRYVKMKGFETIELNTYVQNYPSHKFYYNEDFNALGYHFLKKL